MKTVRLKDHGILPNTDITASLRALFEEHKTDTEFLFEDGDYYFSPTNALRADYRLSNTDVIPLRTLAILLKDMKNCALKGNGARLWL